MTENPTPEVELAELDLISDFEVVADLAVEAATSEKLNDNLVLVRERHGDNHRAVVVDIRDHEKSWADRPHRLEENIRFGAIPSFIEYLERFETSGTQVMRTSLTTIKAVLDSHVDAGTPGHGLHTATLELALSDEAVAIHKADRHYMSQEAFAEFIDEMIRSVASPPAADLMEMIQFFEGHTSTTWKSAVRLRDGSRRIEWNETMDAQVVREGGSTDVPGEIVFSTPLFKHDPERTTLSSRLRYRIQSGKLAIAFLLEDFDEQVETRMQAVLEEIEVDTGLSVWTGAGI